MAKKKKKTAIRTVRDLHKDLRNDKKIDPDDTLLNQVAWPIDSEIEVPAGLPGHECLGIGQFRRGRTIEDT